MKKMFFVTTVLVLCAITRSSAIAQTQIEVHPCTERGNSYNCDRHTFDQLLANARTVSIQTPRFGGSSYNQLQQLVASLGKTVQSDSPDLAFVLTSPDPNGVYFGPSDRKLATINIYYRPSSSNPGQLIWTESYSGQPDTRWPIAVHAVIQQLRSEIKHP
jgi:hypothetical protein